MEDDLLAGARDMSHEASAAALAPSPIAAAARSSTATAASTLFTASTSAAFLGGSDGKEDKGDVDGASRSAMPLLLEVVDRLYGTAGTA